MKMPIEWHKDCLKNAIEFEARERDTLVRMQDSVRKTQIRNAHYARQIEEAERRGMGAFDAERLLKIREP